MGCSLLYTRVNMEDRWKGQAPLFMNCFGDSLTEGFGLRKGRYWLEIAAREIHGIRFRNFGSCGSCHQISFKGKFFLERAGSQDEIFIMGGTNDLLCRIRLSSLKRIWKGDFTYSSQFVADDCHPASGNTRKR